MEILARIIAALARLGVFDVKHARMVADPNIPIWLALLYIGYEVAVNAILHAAARRRSKSSRLTAIWPRSRPSTA